VADDKLELTDAEEIRDVLAKRAAKKQQQSEVPLTLEDIKPGMPAATRQKIMDKIMSVWNK
jgi:hypothetical protein